jgi:hypothetical protein
VRPPVADAVCKPAPLLKYFSTITCGMAVAFQWAIKVIQWLDEAACWTLV